MHRTAAVAAAYPPHDVVPDTKGRLPPKAGALGSDSHADDAAARFFASDRFATLCAHAYDLGALQQPSAYDADGGAGDGGAVEAVLGLPTLRQLVLDADAGDGRHLVPGADADDRRRLVDAWAARVVRVVPTPPVHTPEEWLKQQTAIARVAGPPTAKRLAVHMVTAVSRDFVTRPHRWALSGVAVLFATTGAQAVFVEAFGNHLVPIFGQFYASDVDTVNRLSADLATALARQLITLPGTVWSALGDKRLSPARAAGRIAVQVALPLTTNLILLTPASMLLPAGAGVVGVTALLALTPLGEAVLGETLTTRAGQAGATLTLTGATALAARLALQTIPGVSFAAGTLQFAVASQLTTQVAQSMLATMSEGQLISPEPGPSAFKLMLQEAERHYMFLQFRYHAREATRKAAARVRRVYGATWGRVVDPLVPESLRFLSPALVASFATAWGLWFAYASLPFHLDALQYECHTWVVPLRNALKRLMPWLAGLATKVGVGEKTQTSVAEEVAKRAGMAYRIFHQGVYQQLWHPFLTHILQDQLELPARANAAVDGVLDACKRRYPWAEAVLAHKPFAKVVKRELLQRWHLDYLFDASLEHLFLRSPLSTFLSLATDTRQGAPQQLVGYLATDAAEPFVRSMRAVYDARADVYTGVRLAFVEASLPADAPRPNVAPVPAPTTDALLGRLADAAERAHATAPPHAYAQLQDAWADYTEAFGPDQADHHPDATADAQRRATFVRLSREAQTDASTRPLPPWVQPGDARHERARRDQAFVHECHRLTRDLRHGVQQRRRAETKARTDDLAAYRRRVDRETKRTYLRDVEYAAKVMRYKQGLLDATAVPLPPGFVAVDVTEAELDEDVSVDDLRAMAYSYRETTEAVAAWAAVHAEAQRLAEAPHAPPLPPALQERLDRTNRYAHRLLHPFQADKGAGVGRLWMGIKTHTADLATLQQLTRATDIIVADHRRRLLVYQSYVALVGEVHRPTDPTDAEWAQMEAMAYAVKVARGGVAKGTFVKALKQGTDDKGTTTTTSAPKTVAKAFDLLHTHDKAVYHKAKRVARDRRTEWTKRGTQRDRAFGDWDKVLCDRYGRRAAALKTLTALGQAGLKGHTAALRTLRGRLDRRRREGTLGLDDASRSPAHVFAPTSATPDLRAWVAANGADPTTRKAHAEAQALLGTLPDPRTLAMLRRELQIDNDVEGLDRFDATLARVQGEMDGLRRSHAELASLRKVAFWQHAEGDLAQVDRHTPLQTRSWWPFASPRWAEWRAPTAKAHRAALDDHARRVKAAHLPVAPHAFDAVDVAAKGGGWATLVDAAPADQLPSIERRAAVAYLKVLGDHERRLRAYVDASLDTELARVVRPEVPLPADAEAPALRKATQAALATLRADLAPQHAEREGYVHPLLQHLTAWTDARYVVHDERRRVRATVRAYADALHGKTDTYTTQRALAQLKRAQADRRRAWTDRAPLPPATPTRRPDRAKSGHATATGKAATSAARHVEAQLHATVQAEARTWEAELTQLDAAVDLAEAMAQAQAPAPAQSNASPDLAKQCDRWTTELAALARTPDGAVLADALRPQLMALRATDTLYTQTQALAAAQTAWTQQLAAVQAHTAASDSIVDYLTKPLAQLNPFASSLNADTRTLLARTATLDELAKQVQRARRAQAKTLSDAHAQALDAEWDRLSRAREPTLREALGYVEAQFETSNAAYEKAVYTRDGKGSTRPEWQLNERRELQHLAWQRLRALQVPGRQPSAFANDPRVVRVNQRVARHRQAMQLRDKAANAPWTPATLAKQRQMWRTLAQDPTADAATVAATEAAYLTGRAKLLGEAHAQAEGAVAAALAQGATPPATLSTPAVDAAMRAYDRLTHAHPSDTAAPAEAAHTTLATYVREWPARWQAVLDAKAGGAAERQAWAQRSEALVQDAPPTLRAGVRARVEQRRPAAPKLVTDPSTLSTTKPSPDGSKERVQQSSLPGTWAWPWWAPSAESDTTTVSPDSPSPPIPGALAHTLKEASDAWDTYTKDAPTDTATMGRSLDPADDATYATLTRMDAHVQALRKLSARYDAVYDRATTNERREAAASTVRAAQHAQLKEAEDAYTATETVLANHWRETAKAFGERKAALDAALNQGKVYDTEQRYPPDERLRRLTQALTSTRYNEVYAKAAKVPPGAVGRLGSALRQTTEALRPKVTRDASPAALHETVPTTTTSPPGELADFLMRTDRLRTFGRLDAKVRDDTVRMERERARLGEEASLTLPSAYQTTRGLQRLLAQRLRVGEAGSTKLTQAEFNTRYDPDAPYYGFQPEFEALARVQALNVALILEQSPKMLEALGLRTQPKTAFALAQHLWDHPDKVAAVDARLRDALKTLDKMPTYKGYSQQPRHTSLEGVRIAAWQYLRRDGAKYMLSLLPGGNKGVVDLSPAFSKHGNDPQLGRMKATALHINDEYEFTRTLGADSDANEVRRLLLLTVARREANEPEVLGKAFEQYAVNHATAWDFDTSNDAVAPPCDPRLAHLGHWVNYVHANLRTTRPTFDWRVAAFELVGEGVLESEEVQRTLGHPRETTSALSLRNQLMPDVFRSDEWKAIARVLGRSSVLAGDNPQYWATTRSGLNLKHTSETKLHRYVFLVLPNEYLRRDRRREK